MRPKRLFTLGAALFGVLSSSVCCADVDPNREMWVLYKNNTTGEESFVDINRRSLLSSYDHAQIAVNGASPTQNRWGTFRVVEMQPVSKALVVNTVEGVQIKGVKREFLLGGKTVGWDGSDSDGTHQTYSARTVHFHNKEARIINTEEVPQVIKDAGAAGKRFSLDPELPVHYMKTNIDPATGQPPPSVKATFREMMKALNQMGRLNPRTKEVIDFSRYSLGHAGLINRADLRVMYQAELATLNPVLQESHLAGIERTVSTYGAYGKQAPDGPREVAQGKIRQFRTEAQRRSAEAARRLSRELAKGAAARR